AKSIVARGAGLHSHEPGAPGMSSAASGEPPIVRHEARADTLVAQSADGRTVSVPLAWSSRLANATPPKRSRFEIIGTGEGVHWPEIDEDVSARGMLQGIPACPLNQAKAKRRRA